MSQWDEADVDHLALLSRIKLTDEEKRILDGNLKKILKHMATLDEINTDNVEPCTHILETMTNVMRADEPISDFDREDFLKNSPDQVGGMIKVPTVIQFEE